ncbi:protein SLOW GREEN 1, chloroplastic isoform X2 [Manihot esculenta]|uniref:protein SLOW GREEN 1, chloroplastic isoform X2 n=1 Tax=Manihot esculenta TaxID=3983 RepID=UPI000B5D571D|nr:protein SLOW GREEN 1, chloroplastic isoform X2 [Manihot esculenta]
MGSMTTFSPLYSHLHVYTPKFPNHNLPISSKPPVHILHQLRFHRVKLHISSKLPLSPFPRIPNSNLSKGNGFLAKFLCEKLLISFVGAFVFMGCFGYNTKPSLAIPCQTSESSANIEEKKDTQVGKSEDEMFEEVLKKEPKNVEALKVVVYGMIRRGKTKEALKYVGRLIDIDPEEVEWRLLEALCYEMLGQLSKAKSLFKEILEERPLLIRALHGLAMVMHKNFEGPTVFEMLNKALEVARREKRVTEERNVRILIAQMHLVKGIIYSLLDRKNEAAERFETYKSLVPEEFPQRGFLDDVVLAAKTESQEQFQEEFETEFSYRK